MLVQSKIREFLNQYELPSAIYNEIGLQLELAIFLRAMGFHVELERPFHCRVLEGHTAAQKKELDLLLISKSGTRFAIELKLPLKGQVPEQLYSYSRDLAFVEALVRENRCDVGIAIICTNNPHFWTRMPNQAEIYNPFRGAVQPLRCTFQKPTGGRNTFVRIEGTYHIPMGWSSTGGWLPKGRYVMLEVIK